MSTAATQTPELAVFSKDIKSMGLNPLWERTVSQKPGSPCQPNHWKWENLKPQLLRSCDLIGTKDADRRVLMLENPQMPGSSFIANTLFTGLQIILPGEIAAAHRHTPNALRFVVEGEGAYTAVNGERVMISPGDFIVTPNWAWHDHGNIGTGPVVWMDGLDSAFTKFFGATFGSALLPVDYVQGAASPLLKYPYARTLEALHHLHKSQALHASHGVKLRYANPANGKYPFPTMAAFMQFLPKGFEGKPWRTTENIVFNVAEGSGSVVIAGTRFVFSQHDIFVAPSWCDFAFRANEDCVIFSYSDRAAQEAMGFHRDDEL